MSFLKETDYSGSRSYEREPTARAVIDQFLLRLSLTFAWTRLQIEKILCAGVAPLRTSSLIDHGDKHFTVLGSTQKSLPARRRITEIFPIAESDERRVRNDNSPCR